MASPCGSQAQKQLECPLCKEVLNDPVTTPCGHNFCQACLQHLWGKSEACRCPACDKAFASRPEISVNSAFKELADTFKRMSLGPPSSPSPLDGEVACDVCAAASLRVSALKSCLVCLTSYCDAHLEAHRSVATLMAHRLIAPAANLRERLCGRHEKLLEMFCRDEQQCVCRFCTESQHNGHSVVSVAEESEDRKVQMKMTQVDFDQKIQERQNKLEEFQNALKLSTISATQERTKNEQLFDRLIALVEESRASVDGEIERSRRAAELRAEGLTDELRREIAELQSRNTELSELLDTDDPLHLLQRFPSLTSPPPTREWSEIRIHTEHCAGTPRKALSQLVAALTSELERLKTDEIKRVQSYAVDVELDPETAHPNISLSDDGKTVGRAEQLRVVPDNPRRFDPVICVLAKRGFLSGRFYFQVEVGSKTFWDVGVVNESANRKGQITSKPENGFWTMRLRGGDEYRALDSPSVLLSFDTKPQTVGVFADYEEGTVSFFDVDARSHIYTFAGCMFSERVFPFFSPGVCDEGRNTEPLIISTLNKLTPATRTSDASSKNDRKNDVNFF
ncbi:E3 ubiquitin-protein ligase TRIM39-like [Corythoichthys intestinalis]|uniref:E3 ubiquitin-protein ligase TRIM39-like n=1 Tax=Corythoichthys intestinalis TaxID=161448 RepID=UPI0025A50720|nr:E3 ubiquitin-protein ligase TRIM39-like [Corythoichthys intestinalis]XP_061810888.1 E3 ubiquitin-protein ligase TRIM39-like [Nerophis lumbriciformis]